MAQRSPMSSRRSSGPLPTLESGGDSPQGGQSRLQRRQSLPGEPASGSLQSSGSLPERILGMRTSLPREVLEEPAVEGTPEAGVAAYQGGPPPVAGVLEKWVNYGKGWRPRWFILERGLLSYYKLSGPDKVSIAEEKARSAVLHILGKEGGGTPKRASLGGGLHHSSSHTTPPRALGSVHMMLASIRESGADDKKFYVHTGTKTLHLRAQSREDRIQWVQQLREAKELFKDQRGLLPPPGAPVHDSLTETLEKLRIVLVGTVDELKIEAVEELVREEAQGWQVRLQAEREKRRLLLEYVRTLEADKVDLETAVLDHEEDRIHGNRAMHDGEDADSEDDSAENGKDDATVDSDGDDLDDTSHDKFFDAADDFVEADKVRKSLSRKHLPAMSEETEHGGSNSPVKKGGPGKIVRRKQLPALQQEERSVSLWSIIKDNVGKDLQKVCLPVYFNEPISALQKCCEDLEYTDLLDKAYEAGVAGNALGRVLYVAAFAVSGYAATEGRTRKPFNPLLGETYEAERPEQGIKFISEKVSHHPTIVACHCQGRGWTFYGDSNVKSKFWGRSIQVDPVGVLTLEFDDGEVFQWSKVTTSIYNLIIGKLYCDHYGTMRIQGNQELSAKLKFKEQSILHSNPHQVRGVVTNSGGEVLATIFGKWDDALYYVMGDPHEKKLETLSTSQLLWQRSPPPSPADRYGLSRFAITLNEITPGLKEKLPPTDGRLRPDQRALENGEYDVANEEKLRLEQKQRAARKMQEHGWKPRWFTQDERSGTFLFQGGYWESRESGDWQGCKDIYGI